MGEQFFKDPTKEDTHFGLAEAQIEYVDGEESAGDLEAARQNDPGPPPAYSEDPEDIVQVVYQSNQNGSLVGIESTLLSGTSAYDSSVNYPLNPDLNSENESNSTIIAAHQQPSRATSTLPSVAEESSSGGVGPGGYPAEEGFLVPGELGDETTSRSVSQPSGQYHETNGLGQTNNLIYTNGQFYPSYDQQLHYYEGQNTGLIEQNGAIYSTINRQNKNVNKGDTGYEGTGASQDGSEVYNNKKLLSENQAYSQGADEVSSLSTNYYGQKINFVESDSSQTKHSTLSESQQSEYPTNYDRTIEPKNNQLNDEQKENIEDLNDEINQILSRQKQGAAESGSLKNNFRKKLGISVSTNENDLTAHRQKLLESQEAKVDGDIENDGEPGNLPKFKRTHSVSFNVGSPRVGRHSVDIRNLPSYLTVKRASIVDVAKGAMSSLMHSFGGTGSISSSLRRDSSPDDEPIFEEPIAPTLSLGQRVALVKNSGAEFGTVGWIGQLPDVDDDWIVGVIFDNMIGNSDGAYAGVRYFYARENYAMFVPLSSLTKTDNYIGRPETGTMLSRMSVSLKPGQLISIQRSSIRLQHCFLNAPHQRVGHDVRAVSNRLHCQCHNCGPCAHLTKQGRVSAVPPFGAHHAPNKKNSLAHAAVEILAHHHHHYHEEEHKEEDYQFGDNAAHACNFVRYSCCQQTGTAGHDFSADCGMVRPELLDNLIHAPRAPHRRSRPRRRHQVKLANQQLHQEIPIEGANYDIRLIGSDVNYNQLTLESNATMKSWNESETNKDDSGSSYSSGSSRSSSNADPNEYDNRAPNYDSSSYYPGSSVYNTIDTRMSIMDQQRFIYQRDSSALYRSQPSYLSDEDQYRGRGLGSSIRRCFNCITGRNRTKPKRRKLSTKDRNIEYRRKQFTFVPSTLAKPHEDFASHGIMMPAPSQNVADSNSDYSSYSKSSSSSRSVSPNNMVKQGEPTGEQHQTMTMEHEIPTSIEQLKSSYTMQSNHSSLINYGDYTFSDGYGSYKKNEGSYDSALTEQGNFEAWTSESNDTLKQIVEQSVNEQVEIPRFASGEDEETFSPITSSICSTQSRDQVEISSPTVSLATHDEEDLCQKAESMNLNQNNDSSSDE